MMERKHDWDIRSRSENCHTCSRPFHDQEKLHSMLVFDSEGYLRQDYCESCRPSREGRNVLSVWQGVFRFPPPPPEEPMKKESVETLLRNLMEDGAAESVNTIYILAVMLERRRIFLEKDVQRREDGVKLRVYEHRKSGEVFLIPDPELKLAELERVQDEVVAMLGGEPRKPRGGSTDSVDGDVGSDDSDE